MQPSLASKESLLRICFMKGLYSHLYCSKSYASVKTGERACLPVVHL